MLPPYIITEEEVDRAITGLTKVFAAADRAATA
jgi:adenosylmethionine-8-amino-7-oxononanoate aminotransferase